MRHLHDDLFEKLNTDAASGLSSDEAKRRLAEHGPNKFEEAKPPSVLKLIWDQINSMLIYILIGAAVLSAIVGETSDAIIIGLVILLNSVIGVIQETKAEKALQELQKMSTPKAIVRRDGAVQEISSEELVKGDIVLIDAGRLIPADIRLIETANLKVEESSLTGESTDVEKDANWEAEGDVPLGDQKNMAFSSTLATYGRATGVVVRTGMETEIGKIAKMLANKNKELTPLQKRLDELGKILGIGAIIISFIIFMIGFFQGRDVADMFLIAISLAVAAIPEGLPAIVTIVLAIGVQRMIKQNAVVRKLPAVETLGAVNVICSDKTGTLTLNKMTVTDAYANGQHFQFPDQWMKDNPTASHFIKAMVLCNDASIEGDKKTGDPTEIALVDAGQKIGLDKKTLDESNPRIDEIPFDSDRKMMSTVHQTKDATFLYAKGALESILSRCTMIEKNGHVSEMTESDRQALFQQTDLMSNKALRVLTAAYKRLNNNEEPTEENLIFLGMVGMIDPPREEVKASIEQCQQAGIKVVMITGDHQNTALAIAKNLNIAKDEDQTMTGSELNAISDTKLAEKIDTIRVFARVSPEHKVKIVQALKEKGNIVSMTGDGVNDAPSLQQADVGVAMGITGTDVSKGAADIVLMDDNFSTITKAVEEGRNIYKNIKKSILFLLSCNLGEVITLFIAILLGWPAPLTAVHILWVNLVTDTLPAIALGVDPEDPDIMKEKPRPMKERIFVKDDMIFSSLNGLLIGLITLFAFLEGLKIYTDTSSLFTLDLRSIDSQALMHGQTLAFITLSISQLFHSLNLRSDYKSIFQVGLFTNRYLLMAIGAGILIQALIVHIPFFSQWFGIMALSPSEWIFVLGVSLIPVFVNEIYKAIKRTLLSE